MKSFSYHDAPNSCHGLMICAACRKPIEQGQYRVRETAKAYITHHRGCVPHDPEWGRMEARAEKRRQKDRALLEACKAFRSEWEVGDALNDLIEDLEARAKEVGDV